MHHTRPRKTLRTRHAHRLDHQVGFGTIARRPAHDPPRTHVHHRSQIEPDELYPIIEACKGRTWRPITMLTFVALIVARWLGWSAPNLAEAEALKLWDIVEIGLGGYVIGRSAEKILPGLVTTIKKG